LKIRTLDRYPDCVWGLVSLFCLSAVVCAEAKTQPSPLVAQELQVSTPQRIRISRGGSQFLLIKKVAPDYPPEARSRHIQGPVAFKAFISKSGDVEELYPISGDDLLIRSAMRAVQKWKYKPYVFQGRPIEVETQVTVVFSLKVR
jgi:periplasmic protein TonB